MISTATTDPKSGVFQGRQGTGEATVFDSGRFDPVNFMARQAEIARLERDKLDEERKDKVKSIYAAMDKITPTTEIGSQQIYKYSNDLINSVAEAMAQGQDPMDLSTEIGKVWAQGQMQLRTMAALDKQNEAYINDLYKKYQGSPEKYDEEVFAAFTDKLGKASSIEDINTLIKQETALAPTIDIDAPLAGITIEPAIDVTYDKAGNVQTKTPVWDEAALDAEMNAIVQNPVNQREVAKTQKKIDEGKLSFKTPAEYYKARHKAKYAAQDVFVKPFAPARNYTVNYGGGGFANGKWSFANYTRDDGGGGVAVDYEAGQSEPTPVVPFIIDGVQENTIITRIDKKGDKYFATVKYEKMIPAARMGGKPTVQQVDTEIELNDENWAAVESATKTGRGKIMGAINKSGSKTPPKKKATATFDTSIDINE